MKMDMGALNMIAGWDSNGDTIMIEQMPIYGGYCGGVEETAICDVAATIASFVLFNCDLHLDGPIHIRWGSTTTRETLQIAAHAACAVDANTNLLLGNQYYTLAGPCTEMCLLETAAQAVTDTVSGRELVSGSAACKGVVKDKTTGMEARMLSEAATAAVGMEVGETNKMLNNVISIYEKEFPHPPTGKRFQDCYDMKEVVPSNEYLKVYDRALATLRKCGLDL